MNSLQRNYMYFSQRFGSSQKTGFFWLFPDFFRDTPVPSPVELH